MMTLSEIWHKAVDMRCRFEAEATHVAEEHGEECLHAGDMDGYCDWNRIGRALVELDREPDKADSVN